MTSMSGYERKQFTEVKKWEEKEPSLVSSALSKVAAPLVWAVEKVIPQGAIEAALNGSAWVAEGLTDKDDILREAQVWRILELRGKDLALSDRLANEVHNWAIGIAVAEGAAGGAIGLPALPAAIPALVTLALRTIMKIGLCYGFECDGEDDRRRVFSIMSSAGSNSVAEKAAAVCYLRELEVILLRESWKIIYEKAGQDVFKRYAIIHMVRELAKQLGINITKRVALKTIPILGGVVGGYIDGDFINDVAWAARRCHQRLWLASRYPRAFGYVKEEKDAA